MSASSLALRSLLHSTILLWILFSETALKYVDVTVYTHYIRYNSISQWVGLLEVHIGQFLKSQLILRKMASSSSSSLPSSSTPKTTAAIAEAPDEQRRRDEPAPQGKGIAYKTKTIKFLGRTTPIVLQNDNGPCPLLAICKLLFSVVGLFLCIYIYAWVVRIVYERSLPFVC